MYEKREQDMMLGISALLTSTHKQRAVFKMLKPLVLYDAGNSNGKMSQRVYIDQILKPVGRRPMDRRRLQIYLKRRR